MFSTACYITACICGLIVAYLYGNAVQKKKLGKVLYNAYTVIEIVAESPNFKKGNDYLTGYIDAINCINTNVKKGGVKCRLRIEKSAV